MKKQFIKPIYLLYITVFGIILKTIVVFEKQDPEANIQSFGDALWYSLVTLTTVGYGDNYPITPVGKILGMFIILSSLGLLGFLIGRATNLIQNYMEKKKEGYYGTKFKDHFVIIGWNTFGKHVAEQIILAGNKLAIVTDNKDDIDIIYKWFTEEQVQVLFTDLNNYNDYKKVNLSEARSTFINIGDDSKSLVFVINMKKHFKDSEYIVSLHNAELRETFQAVGVKHVLGKNEIASKLVASYIFEPDVATLTEDLIATAVDGSDFDIQQYKVLPENPFVGVDYYTSFIRLKDEYDCVLLAIVKVKGTERIILKNPGKEVIIEVDDYMILISNGLTKKGVEKSFKITEGYFK